MPNTDGYTTLDPSQIAHDDGKAIMLMEYVMLFHPNVFEAFEDALNYILSVSDTSRASSMSPGEIRYKAGGEPVHFDGDK